MRTTRVYVAGPYTKGDVAVNVRNAIKAGSLLMNAGFAPYIPHFTHFQHMLYPRPYADWIKQDNEFLPCCDILLRLPGKSSGADEEVTLARRLGLCIIEASPGEELSIERLVARVLVGCKTLIDGAERGPAI